MNIAKAAQTGLPLALAFLAVNLGGCSLKQEPPKLAEPIKAELEKHVAGMACITTGQFPHVEDQRSGPCVYCERLVMAGLLTKEADAAAFPSDSGMPQSGSFRYELSEAGQSAYVRGTSDSTYGPDASKFCFGKPRLLQVTRIFGPVSFGGQMNLGIRYLVQLDEANPYLFDPRAKTLDIPLPEAAMEGKPVLYPPQDVTAVLNPSNPNDFYLDTKLKVGPIGEK